MASKPGSYYTVTRWNFGFRAVGALRAAVYQKFARCDRTFLFLPILLCAWRFSHREHIYDPWLDRDHALFHIGLVRSSFDKLHVHNVDALSFRNLNVWTSTVEKITLFSLGKICWRCSLWTRMPTIFRWIHKNAISLQTMIFQRRRFFYVKIINGFDTILIWIEGNINDFPARVESLKIISFV